MHAPRNTWYVAAWSSELKDKPMARTLLGESVLLMRLPGGEAVALGNRCPHRFAPLNLGTLVDDAIQCAYHGLRFDRSGACVHRPGASGGLAAARVPAWRLAERHQLLWIWMGEQSLADPALIPDLHWLDDERRARCMGNLLHSKADYLLNIDNLMDLSHVEFVHGGSLGSPGMSNGEVKTTEMPGRIDVNRWIPGIEAPPAIGAAMGYSGRVDHWLDMSWRSPSNLVLRIGLCAPGAGRGAGREAIALHLLTPETEHSCHYFWANTRDFNVDRPELIEVERARISQAFELEDKPLIEACQRMMGGAEFWSLRPVLLASDGGGVLVRRNIDQLVASESGSVGT